MAARRARDAVRRLGRVLAPFAGLLLVWAIFAALDLRQNDPPVFATPGNIRLVLAQTVVVALGALGMTMVVIAGGIDLSVGSVMALATVTTALAVAGGWPPLLAGLAGVVTGGISGLANGFLITKLRVVPFIVTLGMMGVARGAAKVFSAEEKVDAPATWLNDLMVTTPSPPWLLAGPGVWLSLGLALAVAMVLSSTAFGRHLFAIGGNEAAARLSGVRVERTKVAVYTLSGLLTGLAGLMLFGKLSVGDPTVAVGKELDVIAAVVIGGGSLAGGAGSVLGTLVGALIMAFLRNGCTLVGWPNYVEEIIIGLIIIGAVALDSIRRTRGREGG